MSAKTTDALVEKNLKTLERFRKKINDKTKLMSEPMERETVDAGYTEAFLSFYSPQFSHPILSFRFAMKDLTSKNIDLSDFQSEEQLNQINAKCRDAVNLQTYLDSPEMVSMRPESLQIRKLTPEESAAQIISLSENETVYATGSGLTQTLNHLMEARRSETKNYYLNILKGKMTRDIALGKDSKSASFEVAIKYPLSVWVECLIDVEKILIGRPSSQLLIEMGNAFESPFDVTLDLNVLRREMELKYLFYNSSKQTKAIGALLASQKSPPRTLVGLTMEWVSQIARDYGVAVSLTDEWNGFAAGQKINSQHLRRETFYDWLTRLANDDFEPKQQAYSDALEAFQRCQGVQEFNESLDNPQYIFNTKYTKEDWEICKKMNTKWKEKETLADAIREHRAERHFQHLVDDAKARIADNGFYGIWGFEKESFDDYYALTVEDPVKFNRLAQQAKAAFVDLC